MALYSRSESETVLDVLDTLDSKESPDSIDDPRAIYQYGVDNKMALHVLDLLADADAVEPLQEEYQEEIDYYDRFERTLTRVVTVLDEADVDYCLVKTVTDFRVVPKDVDVLVFEDVAAVEKRMHEADYRTIQAGPLARTLVDESTEFKIDLQEELCLRKVSYIDSDNVRTSIVKNTYDGTTVPTPSDEMELAIYVIHSLSEQMYVLREFFVIDSLLQRFTKENVNRFVEVIEENHLNAAASAFFTLQAALYQRLGVQRPEAFDSLARIFEAEYGRERKKLVANDYHLPHRYTNRSLLVVLKEKMHEKSFRQGWYEELSELKDPRTLGYVLKKLYERQVRTDYTSGRYSR